MKKVCILILCLFSFLGISLADNKYDAKTYLKVNDKIVKNIKAKKGDTIKADLYFEANDIDIYAMLFNMKYDKKKLKLVSAKGDNNFEVTQGEKILVDRINIPEEDNKKVMRVEFKVLGSSSSKVEFTNIIAADIEHEIASDNYILKISNKSVNNIIYSAIGLGFLGISTVFVIKNKKNN